MITMKEIREEKRETTKYDYEARFNLLVKHMTKLDIPQKKIQKLVGEIKKSCDAAFEYGFAMGQIFESGDWYDDYDKD